ncbi:MAG: hypothetical protein IT318_14130 [Anaerolineales bacterium]|nr:hypothetical protein [Anaerolineales bacterium]
MIRRLEPIGWLLAAAAGLAGCAVNPLTPTQAPTATRQPVLVVMVIVTASPTPRATLAPEPRTPMRPEPTEPRFLPAIEPTATIAWHTGSGAPVLTQPPAPTAAAVANNLSAPATAIPAVVAASPVTEDVAVAEQYCIDLINTQRAAAGLAPYARDETVMGIARARVSDMVARGYRGHFDPVTGASLGRAMLLAAGYRLAGENWYGHRSGPVAIVESAMAWFMTDPPHAQGILSTSYSVVGVGIAFNGAQWLLVQNFAGN